MVAVAHVAFDTLKFVESLKNSGMPEKQAIALSEAQKEVFQEALDLTLATKMDIVEVKSDISELKSELKSEITDIKAELKLEIADVKAELKSDILKLNVEMAEVKTDIRFMKWMMGFMMTGLGALILKAFF